MDHISPFEIDGIYENSFTHSKLQKKRKINFGTTQNFKLKTYQIFNF